MTFTFKRRRFHNPKNYYSFALIELDFINTYQDWSINMTLFNFFIQIKKDKKITTEMVEIQNPRTKQFVLVDKSRGKIIKISDKPLLNK